MSRARMYEDDEQERASLMAWMDRRLEWATPGTIPIYTVVFKTMWAESFGTLDTIPADYKEKVQQRYNALRLQQIGYQQLRGES